MTYTHQKIHLNTGDTVVIQSTHQCCAFLLCDADHASFLSGCEFAHSGFSGPIRSTPIQLRAPCTGMWNILLMFDNDQNDIKYSLSVV
ncbi:DUF1883 domain-containing protein [Klebsiella michiganensis]|jgi:hypothetical protein|uniref:DUF1883 domain-containing protein n=1 Tax=Klebsiella michiganensis TaxID=1134687 RepID=UPI0032F086C4